MYKILESKCNVKLEDIVNNHLQNGYQLVGGIAVTNNESAGCYLYAQAVIKYDVFNELEMKSEQIECCVN